MTLRIPCLGGGPYTEVRDDDWRGPAETIELAEGSYHLGETDDPRHPYAYTWHGADIHPPRTCHWWTEKGRCGKPIKAWHRQEGGRVEGVCGVHVRSCEKRGDLVARIPDKVRKPKGDHALDHKEHR